MCWEDGNRDKDITKEKVENKANAIRPKNAPKVSLYGSLCESAVGQGMSYCVCETVSEWYLQLIVNHSQFDSPLVLG